MLCCRNPWGSREWSGKWSDDSDAWDTPQGKKIAAALLQIDVFEAAEGIKAPAFNDPDHKANATDG